MDVSGAFISSVVHMSLIDVSIACIQSVSEFEGVCGALWVGGQCGKPPSWEAFFYPKSSVAFDRSYGSSV